MHEDLRPAWHFTTADRWLNDPNGLVYHDGTYHLFFQSNPHGPEWGEMSWGHAVSADLVHWTDLGTAIPATETEMVFSGSAVVDEHGTAGFGAGALVAVYTSAYRAPSPRAGIQAQSLAVSSDGGATWSRYEGNPVLDIGSSEFRDPYVFRYQDHWVMAVVVSDEHRVQLYTSPDLRTWTFSSAVGPTRATGGLWECPALVPVPVEGGGSSWALLVSLNPGGPTGGSATQYLLGEFDGYRFVPDEADEPDWLDHGHDYYAAVAWNGTPDGRALTIAWAGSWQYASDVPAAPWRGAMSLVRELRVVAEPGGRRVLAQHPILPDDVPVPGGPLVARLTVRSGPGALEEVRLLDASGAPTVVLVVDGDARTLVVDRSTLSDLPAAAVATCAAAALPDGAELDLLVVADGAVVEVFANGGTLTFCETVPAGTQVVAVQVAGRARTAAAQQVAAGSS